MITIIDYKAGNLTSVKRALDYLEIPCRISARRNEIEQSQGIIFPGVGAAGSAMKTLTETGLDLLLRDQVASGKPLLGICLGSQIVLEFSPENSTSTLCFVPGQCQRFHQDTKDEDGRPINIPHMGWNQVKLTSDCLLFSSIEPDAEFYFVHSYYPDPDPKYVLGTTTYGIEFCSVLGRTGLWATQFHPEKSGRPGLTLLRNFYSFCREEH